MEDHKPARPPIWILLFLVPVALVALPQIVWWSNREVRLPADAPPEGSIPDLQALAARAREVRAERDRFGRLLYTLAADGASKISLRCDTSAPAEKSLSSGRALAALVAYRVTRNPLERDGYGVYLAASRAERVRYDVWGIPGQKSLGVYRRVHPEQLGKMPMAAACEVLKEAWGEKAYRKSPNFRGRCDLEAHSETRHMIFLDLLVDLHQPRALEPAARSQAATMWQTVVLEPTTEIHDEINLTFEGAGQGAGSPIQMTAEGRMICLDVNTHL